MPRRPMPERIGPLAGGPGFTLQHHPGGGMVQTTSRIESRAIALWAVAIAFGLSACRGAEPEPDGQPAPRAGRVISDAEIVSIVGTANNGEIQGGQLALQKSRNNAVRQFAQRMITEHTALNQRLMGLRVPADGMAGPGPIAQQLTTNTQRTMQVLQPLEGMQFDRTYMQNQVEIHQWLLNTLDDALIPSARDNELERDLRDARDIVASHLQQAQQIRASMGHGGH